MDLPHKIKCLEELLEKSNRNVIDLKDSLTFVLEREKQTANEYKKCKEQNEKLLEEKQQINKDLLMKYLFDLLFLKKKLSLLD